MNLLNLPNLPDLLNLQKLDGTNALGTPMSVNCED